MITEDMKTGASYFEPQRQSRMRNVGALHFPGATGTYNLLYSIVYKAAVPMRAVGVQ